MLMQAMYIGCVSLSIGFTSFLLGSVERGSLADSCGLKVGDQILEVNGHDFQSILHAEAASILKTYPTLMITVRVCDVTMLLYLYHTQHYEHHTVERQTMYVPPYIRSTNGVLV